jgi:hypothetical protein
VTRQWIIAAIVGLIIITSLGRLGGFLPQQLSPSHTHRRDSDPHDGVGGVAVNQPGGALT